MDKPINKNIDDLFSCLSLNIEYSKNEIDMIKERLKVLEQKITNKQSKTK